VGTLFGNLTGEKPREGRGRRPVRRGEGRKGKGEGERRDRGNGDCRPTIFGLKVALTLRQLSFLLR